MSSGFIIGFRGRNFSGRSARLRAPMGPYLGPELSTFLSGIASTVRDEIAIGAGNLEEQALAEFGLEHLSDRNPFTLSGGEQALVATAAIAASRVSEASLDCCFEQLDDTRRISAVEAICRHVEQIMVADNEFEDMNIEWTKVVDMDRPDHSRIPPDVEARPPPWDCAKKGCSIELRNVSFEYRAGRRIFDGADLVLTPGRVTLLEGQNGVGKSTLAKILTGILKPLAGDMEADGVPAAPWQRPGQLVAYHHQDPDVQLFSATVRSELLGVTPQSSQAFWAAEAFGLNRVLSLHPLELPFTLRKRVALAVTLGRTCPWYILDEPTLGQDSKNAHAIAQILLGMAARGAGVIVISHSPRFRALFPSARRIRVISGRLSELS